MEFNSDESSDDSFNDITCPNMKFIQILKENKIILIKSQIPSVKYEKEIIRKLNFKGP